MTAQPCKVLSFNPRAEKHGEANQLAGDLKLQAKVANGALSMFDPQLRDMLYARFESAAAEAQPALDGVDPPTDKPNLRCARLGVIPLTCKFPGYLLHVPFGATSKTDVDLEGVEVNNIRIECHEGGTVTVTFRLQFTCTDAQAGKLCSLIGSEVEIDLEPSEEAQERLAA